MDMKLEIVVVPVTDVDQSKEFYKSLGWRLDADIATDESFRVVQLTPPGSACSVTLMRNDAAGSVKGLHLVVGDLEAARTALVARGAPVSEPFHFGAQGQTPGMHPDRVDHGSFASFDDPDGNSWLLQEVRGRG